MKDLTDREIKIGDIVAFHSASHKKMFRGRVYNIGAKMVCVEYAPYDNTIKIYKHKAYPNQCIVLESEDPVTFSKIPRII